MAREDGTPRGSGAAPTEPSLADGTGEGNAPIDGTSASSDPHVLAGTQQDPNATSLNDDDYPDDIAEATGQVEDVEAQAPFPDEKDMSGQTTPADAVSSVDRGADRAAPRGGNARKA
ncbi:hypothetical protein [Noviherbaspirillum pedocola]|uniref:Uncharacterized protein n=1 Tax=Noviherbaspirillum pedocola TaxID=2801341 RepID=A0A934W3L4_9BURK|nr:hypothetical protein [Noviherbaspirillum pedocola]MBK4737561.1 hypothetical protein [Noviherbaspirillum pedocola]